MDKLRIKKKKTLAQDPFCHYCGRSLVKGVKSVDHKIPKSKGGSNRIENLLPACVRCNRLKGNMDYSDFVCKIQIYPSKTHSGKNFIPKVRLVI